MARGRLRCIGNSIRLKARFGSGYRVSIRVAGASIIGCGGSGSAEGGGSEAVPAGSSEQGEIQPEPLTDEDLQPTQQHPGGQNQEQQPQQPQQQQQQQ